ncbi:DUF1501 domain-containing protein [Olleya aquimaris]|uniref:Putative secreted protein (Por secretion system target) n=1 Tax=Olleya aquimaris TaxID=639310 RepID=A0A327RM26_9FLAO|nr:DUF1501 domain-containing protein [Olleya aquimaris]RAJ18100.1 putative secreted protein (Por secretion system target) [Olleya aquimaris]
MCETSSNKKLSKAEIHDQEHKNWNRRSFLQALGLVGGGTIMLGGTPITASRPSSLASALSESENDRVLVLIRLKGGNDGLNTIVPIDQYDIYANLRPTLKHNLNSLYNLSADVGIPTSMTDLQSLWGNGAMKVAHGVGYQYNSLSHFRGSDIWASTDAINEEPTGWFGRYFEQLYPDYLVNPPTIPAAVQIGSIGNLIFDGNDSNYAFSVANPQQLETIAQNGTLHDMTNLPGCTYGDQLQFMRGTTNTTFNYAGIIHNAYTSSTNDVTYLNNQFGRQLANVARMIKGNLGTKVYMVTLGGFDTHANQAADHDNLMITLSNTVKQFFDDLAVTGHDQEVLAMTISEFGRRPDENGSLGTDHGAASPLLLFGPGLQGNGFIGNHPSLTTLDNDGNLIYNLDFRQIYATVMQEWLCIDPAVVNQALLGQTYNTVDLGFNCAALTTDDYDIAEGFTHYVLMTGNQTIIKFKNPMTQHTVVKLYDILGKEVTTLKNEMLLAGEHEINVKETAQTRLSTGQYIYRISVGQQHYSKSIIIR